MSDVQQIREIMAPLPRATVADVMAQLEALLEALPADAENDRDSRLRHDIEVLLAGYKAATTD